MKQKRIWSLVLRNKSDGTRDYISYQLWAQEYTCVYVYQSKVATRQWTLLHSLAAALNRRKLLAIVHTAFS
jgi:hypothetical protein